MLDNYRDLIDQLIGTPAAVRSLVVAGASPATTQLMVELRDRDELILEQLQTVIRAKEPYLRASAAPAPVADGLAADGPAAGAPAAVLAGFELARGELVSLLMNLTLRDWERSAIHETAGEVTVVELVEQHADFDEDHLERLQRSAE